MFGPKPRVPSGLVSKNLRNRMVSMELKKSFPSDNVSPVETVFCSLVETRDVLVDAPPSLPVLADLDKTCGHLSSS